MCDPKPEIRIDLLGTVHLWNIELRSKSRDDCSLTAPPGACGSCRGKELPHNVRDSKYFDSDEEKAQLLVDQNDIDAGARLASSGLAFNLVQSLLT